MHTRVFAFDVEATGLSMRDRVLSIAYWSDGGKRGCYLGKSEREIISSFISAVHARDPDIIATWNGSEFDFPFLQERCKKNGMRLTMGRDNRSVSLFESTIMGKHRKRLWLVHLPGRTHLDIAYSRTLNPRRLGLKDIAERRRLGAIREDRARLEKLDKLRLRRYNLNDARLTYILAKKILG